MAQDNIHKLYQALQDRYELGDENDFRNYLNDPDEREALRKALESEYEVGDSASFSRYLGYDEQKNATPQQSVSQPAEQPLSEEAKNDVMAGAAAGGGINETLQNMKQASAEQPQQPQPEAGQRFTPISQMPKPAERPTQQPEAEQRFTPISQMPTNEARSNLQNSIASAMATSEAVSKQQENIAAYREGAKTAGRIQMGLGAENPSVLGNKPIVVEKTSINPETGEREKTYITESGNEYGGNSRALAENERAMAEAEQKNIEEKRRLDDLKTRMDSAKAAYEQAKSIADRSNGLMADYNGKSLRQWKREYDDLAKQYGDLNWAYNERNGLNGVVRDQMFMLDRQIANGTAHNAPIFLGDAQAYRNYTGEDLTQMDGERFRLAENVQKRTKDILDAAKAHANDRGFFASAGAGLADAVSDAGTWDFGLSGMEQNAFLKQITEKMEKGEELSDSESALLDAVIINQYVTSAYGGQLGWGYEAGKVTGESLPFMAEMILNPLSGTGNALAKRFGMAAYKYYARRAAGSLAGKLGKRFLVNGGKWAGQILGDVIGAGGMTATTGQGRVIEDALRRNRGDIVYDYDPERNKLVYVGVENGEDLLKSYAKAFGSVFKENHSELLGEYFAPFLNGLIGDLGGRIIGKEGREWTSKMLSRMQRDDLYKFISDFEKNAKWSGSVGEFMEEVAGDLEGYMMNIDNSTLDADPETGIFNPEKLAHTFVDVALMSGVFSGVKTLSYRDDKTRARQVLDRFDDEGAAAFGNNWTDIRNNLSIAGDDRIKQQLTEILSSPYYSHEQRLAAERFARAAATYRGLIMGERKANGVTDQATSRQQMTDSYENGLLAQGAERNAVGKHVKDSAQQLSQLDGGADAVQGIDMLVNTGAFAEDVDEYIDGLAPELQNAARDYAAASFGAKGVWDAARTGINQQVEQREKELSPAVAETADGRRTITMGTLADGREVLVVDDNGESAIVYQDGKKQQVKSSQITGTQTYNYDEVMANYRSSLEQSAADEATFVLNNNANTRMPYVGLVLHNGEDTYAVVDTNPVTGEVTATRIKLDKKGQMVPDSGVMITLTTQEVLDLQNQYYDNFDSRLNAESPTTPAQQAASTEQAVSTQQTSPTEAASETEQSAPAEVTTETPAGLAELEQQMIAVNPEAADYAENVRRMIDEFGDLPADYFSSVPQNLVAPLTQYAQAYKDSRTAQPAETPAAVDYPRDKDGDLDVDAIQKSGDSQMMADALRSEFGDETARATAQQYLTDAIKAQEKEKSPIKKNGSRKKEVNFWRNVVSQLNESPAEQTAADQEPGLEAGNAAKTKWDAAQKIDGHHGSKTLPGGRKIKGHYVLVEEGAATPSHDPNTFRPNEGFPMTDNGQNANSRDYQNDRNAQSSVMQMAGSYDGRAIGDTPVVSEDGIVWSGNNRVMSGQLAAQNGTDAAYIEALSDNASMYGFTPEQVQGMGHPRVYFVPDAGQGLDYTPQTFNIFNAPQQKEEDSVGKGVKMGKVLTDRTFALLSEEVSRFGSLANVFKSPNACREILRIMQEAPEIVEVNQQTLPRYITSEGLLTEDGQTLLNAALVGYMFRNNAEVLGYLEKLPKSAIRQLSDAMPELMANARMGEYALNAELTEAIKALYQQQQSGQSMDDFMSQYDLFAEGGTLYGATTRAMVDALTGKGESLKDLLTKYNSRAADASTGQGDMFSQNSREDILKGVLGIAPEAEQQGTGTPPSGSNEGAGTPPRGSNEGAGTPPNGSNEGAGTPPSGSNEGAGTPNNQVIGDTSIENVWYGSLSNPKRGTLRAKEKDGSITFDVDGRPREIEISSDEWVKSEPVKDGNVDKTVGITEEELESLGELGITKESKFTVNRLFKSPMDGKWYAEGRFWLGNSLLDGTQSAVVELSPGFNLNSVLQRFKDNIEREYAEKIGNRDKQKNEKSSNPSGNKLVTDEQYEDLKQRLRNKLRGQMSVGIDPEILSIGIQMATYHIEKGARTFADFARAMIEEIGDVIRPYLKSFYNGARDLPEVEAAGLSEGMTPYDEVRSFDVANFDKPATDILASAEQIANENKVETDVNAVIEEQKPETEKRDSYNAGEHVVLDEDGKVYTVEYITTEGEFIPGAQNSYVTYYHLKEKPFGKYTADQLSGIKRQPIQSEPAESTQPEGEISEEERKAREAFSNVVTSEMIIASQTGEKPYKSIVDVRNRAKQMGMKVDDRGRTDILLQELVEDGLARAAHQIISARLTLAAASGENVDEVRRSKELFDRIVRLYEMQPTITQRSTGRIEKQQYSTPLPMAFVADMFAYDERMEKGLEPTAGNGMLTIAVPANKVHVNEIDEQRLTNLRGQGFAEVTDQDATQPFPGGRQYDFIIANPPFGSAEAKSYDGKLISGLDPQIALNALESMKDDGKAVIIIGGNMTYRNNGSISDNVPFFTYLYDRYNVKGVIDMAGGLYQKQGTTYPTRMILIDGRRSEADRELTTVYPPRKDEALPKVENYDDLYRAVTDLINSDRKTNGNEVLRIAPRELESNNLGGPRPSGQQSDNKKPDADDRKSSGTGRGGDNVAAGSQSGGRPVLGERGQATGAGTERGQSGQSGRVSGQRGDAEGDNSGLAQQGGDRGSSINSDGRVVGDMRSDSLAGRDLVNSQERKEEKRELGQDKLPYRPHNSAFSLESVSPAAMVESMDASLSEIEKEVGPIDEFVRRELGYDTIEDAHNALVAEQMDGVAMAIYQMKKGQALIIGDQTGVGKGRQMAALIRWAVRQGKKPIFVTKDANLFSDIYRDLVDIGSGDLRPFIFNSGTGENPGVMTDNDGNVIYKAPSESKQKKIFAGNALPEEYDYAVLSYSQVNKGDAQSREEARTAAKSSGRRAKKKDTGKEAPTPKADFLRKIAKDNYLLLDESHTAAGEGSNTGAFLQSIVRDASGATFASATFAKTPETMPLYAIRTAMSKALVKAEELIAIIKKGGVTLQEIMSRALSESGQMVRRERDMSDVRTDWKTVSDAATVKRARENYDRTIAAFNAIIKFQETYVAAKLADIDTELSIRAASAGIKRGTKKMGVDNVPFANKAFNYTKQLLLALKVDAIVNEVEAEIKAGRHPVIALDSTMESATKDYSFGEVIEEPTFALSLLRGLDSVMQYTVKDENGKETSRSLSPSDLGPAGEAAYYQLQDIIRESTKDIFISPIDDIIERLNERGYKVGELTGRNSYVQRNADGTAVISKRTDKDKKRQARDFNNGTLDVLILNKSAATGISLHSSEKFDDQRQRTMIIAQPLGDINDYMQMIGRIDRTGQVHRGYYINLGLPVPAENRFLMMLATKLRSLNANTTTSQESKNNDVEAPDLLNKYGSQVIIEYLRDNPDIYEKMGRPLGTAGTPVKASELEEYKPKEEDARRITGRVALLTTEEQDAFYDDVVKRYNDLIKYLDETDSNDLKITVMPLRAKTLSKKVSSEGADPTGKNPFAGNAYVEEVEMDVLRKPMTAEDVRKTISQLAKGQTPEERVETIKSVVESETQDKLDAEDRRYEREQSRVRDNVRKRTEKVNASNRTEEEKRKAIEEYEAEQEAEVESGHLERTNRIIQQNENFTRRLGWFTPGNTYMVPDNLEIDTYMFMSPAIFCGYKSKDSKITPSTTVAVFATLDGRRRVEVKTSQVGQLLSIKNATDNNYDSVRMTNLDNWDSRRPKNTRKKGYIMTGNILQAVADTQDQNGNYPGQLISYTDEEGGVHDGILMPEKWTPSQLRTAGAPIAARISQIKDMGPRDVIQSTDGKVTIRKEWDGHYTLDVPKSKKEGGQYFMNDELLEHVAGREFFTYRGQMEAQIYPDDIEAVVNILSQLGVRVPSGEEQAENEGGKRFRTSKELDSQYPTWLSGQTTDTGQHTTQITGTVNTYKNIGSWMAVNGMAGAHVLDASSGLGVGTQALREMGFDVDDVEPYPSESREAPTFLRYEDVDGEYDVVISNAVLNVIPDDWRADVLKSMADHVKVGGKLIINVRDAKSIESQKQKIELDSPSEILVTDSKGNIRAYQKGFTKQELKEYVESQLGEGWRVEIANDRNSGLKSGTAVVVTKTADAPKLQYRLPGRKDTKRAPETAPLIPKEGSRADISSADVAKVQQKLDSLANNLEKISGGRKNFLKEVADALGAKQQGSKSRYITFEAKNGDIVTLRLADHNAKVSTFDNNNEDEGISIVISRRENRGIANNGDAHVVEFFYADKELNNAEGKPLAKIVRSIEQALYSGEYKDTTGIAVREEVNADELRERFGEDSAPQSSPVRGGYTARQREAYRARTARNIISRAREMAEKLGISDRVTIITDLANAPADVKATLRRQPKAKGWFDTRTGRVVVIAPNHTDAWDVMQTLLHEGVAHYGLRELFGERFDTFLDNVYNNASAEVRDRIDASMRENGWDAHEATEEYLASLAEDTNFENAMNSGWWAKIRSWFMDMLRDLGVPGLKLYGERISDNELRYLLWRSYRNLTTRDNGVRSIFDTAEDIAMQSNLGVGVYDTTRAGQSNAAEVGEGKKLFRAGDARVEYESTLKGVAHRLRETWQDSMLSLKVLQDAVTKETGKKLLDSQNAWMAENRLSSSNAAQQEEFRRVLVAPLMEAVEALGVESVDSEEYDDLKTYMIAKHGLERNRVFAARDGVTEPKDYSGLTSLFGTDDVEEAERRAQDFVDSYEDGWGEEIADFWYAVREVSRFALDKSLATGMISKETYDKLRDQFDYYVPLRGWDETTSDEVYDYIGRQESPLANVIKHAKGRTSVADDPLATLQNLGESAIIAGNRNVVKQHFLNLATMHKTNLISVSPLWLRYDDVSDTWEAVFPDNIDDNDTPEEVARKTEQFNERMEALAESDPDHFKRQSEKADIPYRIKPDALRSHRVTVRQNGRTYVLTVNGNPRAAQAVNGLTNPDASDNAITMAVSTGSRWIASWATAKNLGFIARNLVRDGLYVGPMSFVKEGGEYGVRFTANWWACLAEMPRLLNRLNNNELDRSNPLEAMFYDFVHNGGETGYTIVNDVEACKDYIKNELKRNIARQGWDAINDVLRFVGRWSEGISRFAAYRTSLEMGRSKSRAIYDAKDISVNFSKKGSGVSTAGEWKNASATDKFIYTMASMSQSARAFYAFFNASVQGLENITRASWHNKGKALGLFGALLTMGASQAFLNRLMMALIGGDDDDDYYNIPEWQRSSNFILYLGKYWPGGWLKLPLPIEFGVPFGLGGLFTERAHYGDIMSNEAFGLRFAQQLAKAAPLDPIGDDTYFNGLAFLPTAVRPIGEVWGNRAWTGLPIAKHTPWNEYDPEYKRVYKNAGKGYVEFSKALSEATGGTSGRRGGIELNPQQMEYLVKQYFGGVYNWFSRPIKLGEDAVNAKDFEWQDVPVIYGFTTSTDQRAAEKRINKQYYDLLDEMKARDHERRAYKKDVDASVDDSLEHAKALAKYNDFMGSPEYTEYAIWHEGEKQLERIKKGGSEEDEYMLKQQMIDAVRQYRKSGDKQAAAKAYRRAN